MIWVIGSLVWLLVSAVAIGRGVYWALTDSASYEACSAMGWIGAIAFLIAVVVWANRPAVKS